MRRAAQAAKVEIRASSGVAKILIEKDRAAGVHLKSGGQVRAPIVIASESARKVYGELVGPAALGADFMRDIAAPEVMVGTGHMHLLLNGAPRDATARRSMARRLVYAPEREMLRDIFLKARKGEAPTELICEAILPDILSAEPEEDFSQLQMSVLVHPVPVLDEYSDELRADLRKAVIGGLEKISASLSQRIREERFVLPGDRIASTGGALPLYAARPGVLAQLSMAATTSSAAQIGGLYFCGREAQIGYGLCGAAGRNAARVALKKARRTGAAP